MDLFDKSVTDLQTDIVVGANAITGTLKYIADYSSAGYAGYEASGNYLVIHSEATDADSITVEVVGGVHGEQTLDVDGICICRIANTSQKIRVRAYKDGTVANVKTYSLDSLVLTPSA